MMTQDKAEKLLDAVEDRQFVFEEATRWLECLSEQVKDGRYDLLSRYDEKFAHTNKDVFEFWCCMRSAQINLHCAAEALKKLVAREQLKWERLYGCLERCGGNA